MSYQASLEQTVKQTGVFRCLECGKCTAVCPMSYHDHHFSPRRTVGRALMRKDEALLTDDRLWACLTCLHCSQVCPAGVAYSDLTLGVRTEAHKLGEATVCTHGEAIHAWMRMMADPELKQNRLGWLDDGEVTRDGRTSAELRVADDSDTLFFVGCAPYFDVQFGHIGVDGSAVARAAVRTLNALGVDPQVLADERCCGHDLLWEGDVAGFRKLAELNVRLIHESGAKRVVTTCPECLRALQIDYPAHGVKLNTQVLHLTQLLVDQADSWDLLAQDPASSTRVTYQDPCRLGRHLGIYEAPRQVIRALGFDFVEMPRHRENALCCGTNGWTHCGAANRQIQGERLDEASGTGADVLVTTCLKCQIHFRCAMQDHDLDSRVPVEITDLITLVAERLAMAQSEPA
jgi:Fe-S oxidoreductase